MQVMRLGLLRLGLLISIGAMVLPLGAQPVIDTSNNKALQGTYYFRQVVYEVGDFSGDLGRATSVYGTMTFNGSGVYTINATEYDSSTGTTTLTSGGAYGIGQAGFGWITSPVATSTLIYGLVTNAVFVGSSTESGLNDMFVAAAIGSSPASAATFSGTYSVAGIDFPDGSVGNAQDTFYQLASDGKGDLGTVSVDACIGQIGCTYNGSQVAQSFPNVKYTASNGAFPITFVPGGCGEEAAVSGGNLLPSIQYMYISQDGNFIFGGSPCGWDMFVGVRMGSSSAVPNFSGVYYQAGVDEFVDSGTGTDGEIDSYFGAATASGGNIWDHQRTSLFSINAPVGSDIYDDTFSDGYTIPAGGTYDDPLVEFHYAVGVNGTYRIGFDRWPNLGINVAVQAPTFSSSGNAPYLFPDGVVNTASGAPFTARLSRGEEVTLYGSNLASLSNGEPDRAVWPTQPFGGVQVMVNGVAAAVHDVNPGQVSFQVPWETTAAQAQVQLVNNGVPSNTLTLIMGLTTPGVYTVPSSGIGYAAAQHTSDYSLITPGNPAQLNEPVVIYVDGLGDVSPSVNDGAVGPIPPSALSQAINQIQISIGAVDIPSSSLSYVGLVPESAGLYQINFNIPTTAAAGDQVLTVTGPDSITSEALISISSATFASPAAVAEKSAAPAAEKKQTGRAHPVGHATTSTPLVEHVAPLTSH